MIDTLITLTIYHYYGLGWAIGIGLGLIVFLAVLNVILERLS